MRSGLLVYCWAMLAFGETAPTYNDKGELLRPPDYREWIFLTSGLGMTYGTAPAALDSPAFDNVYVRPESYRAFMESGQWPDGTMFVLEVRASGSHESINKGGFYQNDLIAVEVALKDEKRFPEKWAYFGFPGAPGPLAKTASAFPKARCFACHTANGAVENTFVQFYPTLLEVADRKGTVKPSYRLPVTAAQLYRAIEDQGWEKGHALITAERESRPDSPLASPARLNAVGYSLLQNGKSDAAASLFKFVSDQHPESANAWDSLADAYAAKGDRAAALAASEKVLNTASSDTSLSAAQRQRLIDAAQARIKRLRN